MSLGEWPSDDSHHCGLIYDLDVKSLQSCLLTNLVLFLLLIRLSKLWIQKVTWVILPELYSSTSRSKQVLWKVFILELTTLLRKLCTHLPFFKEFRDIFVWSYEEMHGIDSSIVKNFSIIFFLLVNMKRLEFTSSSSLNLYEED